MPSVTVQSWGGGEREFKKTLGAHLARLRRSRQFPQSELRKRTGLSVEYISQLENGQENPTILTLRNLMENGFEMKLPEFFKRLK